MKTSLLSLSQKSNSLRWTISKISNESSIEAATSGSSSLNIKSLMLTLAFFVSGVGSVIGQCTHSIQLTDSYGDGWNGGTVYLKRFFSSLALALALLVQLVLVENSHAQCYTAINGLWPSAPFTPTCNNVFANITTSGWAGEYSNVNLVAGTTYTFRSSVTTDYITVDNNGAAPLVGVIGVSGTAGINWTCTATGTYRFYTHTNSACGAASVNRTRSISCAGAAFNPCTTIPTLTCGAAATSFSMAASAGAWNTYGGAFSVPGQEKLFQFTPTITGSYAVTMSVSTSYNDFFWKAVSAGCNATGWTYVNDIIGTETHNVTLTAGVSYYFMLDDENTTANTGTISVACAAGPPVTPLCAATPTAPANGATGVAVSPTLSWAAVANATGYDVYFGTANPATTLVSTNQAGLTYAPTGLLGNTTYYWKIVPRSSAGSATGCATWSFVTTVPGCGSATAFGSGPAPAPGTTTQLTTCAFAGEYSTITGVPAATTFTSTGTGGSGNYITIRKTTSAGTIIAAGFSPLTWTSTGADTYVQIVNTNAACGTESACHTLSVSQAAGPCSGTPSPGSTVTSSATVAVGGTVNLSLSTPPTGTGLTYQWQSGPTNTGAWTNVGTSTSTYTPTVSTTTWYRCIVTCAGVTGTSAPVQVTAVVANNIPFSGSSSVACGTSTLIYDHAGASTDYSINANGYFVLNNNVGSTSVISLTGTYATEASYDFLRIYDGTGTAGTLIASYSGSGTITPFTSAAGQTITVQFTSDGSVNAAGISLNAVYSGSCAVPACSGTPNPGATTASTTQVFAGGSTTLGITTAQSGSGITYQWQSGASASGPWTSIGGATSATYVASPTAATYYQCIVTCSAGPASATSTPILISANPYCEPIYTFGKTYGDLISNISIAGTTLSNNSGTAQVNPSYTFFTGQSDYTCNLVAANSYTVNVTVGTWGYQGIAAWIDYNDNNIFEASEKIGATTALIGTGTGGTPIPANHTASFTINLSCAPPLGTHRMRVRDVYYVNGPDIDPCATYNFGETEDYLITIVPGTPFAPAFTATPTTPNCVGAQVTYTATAGQTNYAWTFPGTAGVDYTLVSGGTSASNTAVVTYNNGGSKTITMNYASPLGCASSGAINNTITLGAGTLATTAATGDVIWRGATSVNWQTASNWYYYDGTTYTVAGSTPTTTTRTIIPNNTCVTQQPSVAAGTTVNAKDVIIETGATLTMTTGTLNVNGNFTNNGTFVAGTGKVAFNTASTISGNATTFNDVDLNNGVNFGSSLSTINGIMTMNTGSWVNTNPPTYGTSSVLKYNTGGTYGRYLEWSTTSGPGYPNDVQVSNNTTINYPNTGGAFSTNLSIRRDLTIDAGSNLYMDYNTVNASGSLTVGRNVTVAGDLSLGNQIGGDIYVGGNWTRTTGNFYANNRAVFFNGATGNQTVTKTGGETFPFMVVNKASGNVVLANNVTVTGGLTLTSGLVELGANNLSMGTAALTGGSSTSYVKTASTGVLGRSVAGTPVTFPVGNGSYNRAVLTNTGTTDVFTLRVVDNVTADGTGVGTQTNEAVVKRTWMVNETTSGGSDVTMRLYWNGPTEEINNFVSPSAFIAHYLSTDGLWDNIGKTNEGADFVETNSITSFSPFTISSSGSFAPLPIELVSFQANCKDDNTVAVTWVTASEHNTSHYVVEKSRDGITWSVLGQTAAAGNSTELLTYEMIDSEKASGTTYYRLTQYDNDGEFETFDPVSINCNGTTSNNHITTYPNPSSESFYVSLYTETMEGNGQLTITDASGRPVYSTAVNIQDGNNVFHIGDLNAAPGMYYIQVTQRNTTTDIVKHSLR